MMILVIILTSLLFAGATEQSSTAPAVFKSVACDFFAYENASKVLGGKAMGVDGGMTEDADGRKWACTFRPANGVEGSPLLHFTLTKSTSDQIAKQAFDSIRRSNAAKTGFEEWPGVADEAMFQTDTPNFHFVMVRKGLKTIRIKVNPANGISLDDVKAAAVALVPKM